MKRAVTFILLARVILFFVGVFMRGPSPEFAAAEFAAAEFAQGVTVLGEVRIDDYPGQVTFEQLGDKKSFLVSLSIPKPGQSEWINRERIDVWLLARNSKAIPVQWQPKGEHLGQIGGVCRVEALAMFVFDATVDVSDLRAVVVMVDGQPTAFPLVATEKSTQHAEPGVGADSR